MSLRRRDSSPAAPGDRWATALVALLCLGACLVAWDRSQRTGLHVHDLFHYVIGAKYFDHTGYDGLYLATALALREQNLVDGELVIRDLADRSGFLSLAEGLTAAHAIRDGMGPERWRRFQRDIAFFDGKLAESGHPWREVLRDHGFNPSPVWMIYGTPAIARVELAAIYPFLPGFDLLLLVGTCVLLTASIPARLRVAAALLYWAGIFVLPSENLAPFGWIGNSYLRFSWFAFLGVGVHLLARRRLFAAGLVLSLAAWERLFPIVFVAGAVLSLLVDHVRAGGRVRELRGSPLARLAGGAAVGAVGASLLCLSMFPLEKIGKWPDRILQHGAQYPSNAVGFRAISVFSDELTAYRTWAVEPVAGEARGLSREYERKRQAAMEQRFLENLAARVAQAVFLALSLFVGSFRMPRALGVLFSGTSLLFFLALSSHYYFALLALYSCLLVAECARSPDGKSLLHLASFLAISIIAWTLSDEGQSIALQSMILSGMLLAFFLSVVLVYAGNARLRTLFATAALALVASVALRNYTLEDPARLFDRDGTTRTSLGGGDLAGAFPVSQRMSVTMLDEGGRRIRDEGVVLRTRESLSLSFELTEPPTAGMSLVFRSDLAYPVGLLLSVNGRRLEGVAHYPRIGGLFVRHEIAIPPEYFDPGVNALTLTLHEGKAIALYRLWLREAAPPPGTSQPS